MKKTILFLVMAVALTTQSLVAQVPSYVPTNGLVGYWPFNGNANDESGNGNNGTNNGATLTTDRFGNSNSAYSFNGTNNFIELVNSAQLDNMNDFSISTWYQVNNTSPQFQFLVSKDLMGDPPNGDWDFYVNYNKVKFDITINTNNNSGTQNSLIEPNTWNHALITRNSLSGLINIYINGVLENSFTGYIGPYSNTQKMNFGRQGSSNQHFLNGKLDDIGIWNRALTQQEITNLYNSSLPQTACLPANVPTTGLVGYWPFCGNANDESGNANNGTNNGATLTTDRFGNSNSAYSFNGTNNFIELVNSAQLDNMNDFSISTWYQVNNTSPQFQFLVSKDLMGDPPNGDWDFYVNYNKVKFDITINTNNNSGTQNSLIEPNTWNHALITRNSLSGLINIYINGVLENSFTGYIGPYSNTQKMNFGRQGSSNQHFLNGKLDDIGIWNRALTQQEITNLYNANQCITNITVTDTLIINVGQLSFNDPVTWANSITIAPNPASTQINISFNNITNLNGGTLKIINSLGQEVATTPITTSGTNSTMQLAAWGGSGMYFVQIINPQGQIVDIKKIILQ